MIQVKKAWRRLIDAWPLMRRERWHEAIREASRARERELEMGRNLAEVHERNRTLNEQMLVMQRHYADWCAAGEPEVAFRQVSHGRTRFHFPVLLGENHLASSDSARFDQSITMHRFVCTIGIAEDMPPEFVADAIVDRFAGREWRDAILEKWRGQSALMKSQ